MWVNFYVNENQIKQKTNQSILIKLPKTDWLVWISKRCVQSGTHYANMRVGVVEDGQYEIFRNGKGKHSRFQKIASKTVTGTELAKMCGVEAPKPKQDEYHIPQEINPVYNQKADNELLA